jgi:hypothetical protein
MSPIANLSSASAAFPSINFHLHGHKHGSHVESTDSSGSDASTQAPAGATQNLFGTLLQSLEQVIGLKSGTATPASSATPASAAVTASTANAATATGGPSTASSVAGTSGAPASNALLQNYLNNLSHKLQSDGSQLPKLGSSVSANA